VTEILTAAGPRPGPQRALVVVAHPDDADFGAAGTVAALVGAGADVSYCLVTSGDAGSDHLPIDARELCELREREQTDAAAVLGVDDLVFLRHRDGYVESTLELRRAVAGVIRRTRPDLVICQSPERYYDRIFASHPDHLAAGTAALCAVYPDARNPRAFPELMADGLEPHTVREVWLMAHPEPDLWIDVTDTVDKKLGALAAHVSQTAHRDDLDTMVRGWLAATAQAGGLPAGRLAEAFKVVTTG